MEVSRQYELIAKYLAGELQEKEEENFLEWVQQDAAHQQLLEESRQIWEDANLPQATIEVDTSMAWDDFEAAIAPEEKNAETAKVVAMRPRKQLWRIAAVLLVLLGASFWWYQNSRITSDEWIQVATNEKQRDQIELPDGSIIWLNTNSSISYANNFETNRTVRLEGEAFFDVARDENHPFRIYSKDTKTEVLGTSFNIRAYPNEEEVQVSVSSGKVAFSETLNNKTPLLLTKGMQGKLEKKNWQLEQAVLENENDIAWKTGALDFKETPLREALTAINHYANIDIQVENEAIYNCTLKSNFKDDSVEDIIKTIEFMLNLTSTQDGNTFILSGKGCEE